MSNSVETIHAISIKIKPIESKIFPFAPLNKKLRKKNKRSKKKNTENFSFLDQAVAQF